jgi:hypothetical protein
LSNLYRHSSPEDFHLLEYICVWLYLHTSIYDIYIHTYTHIFMYIYTHICTNTLLCTIVICMYVCIYIPKHI